MGFKITLLLYRRMKFTLIKSFAKHRRTVKNLVLFEILKWFCETYGCEFDFSLSTRCNNKGHFTRRYTYLSFCILNTDVVKQTTEAMDLS